MIKAGKVHKERVIEILSECFDTNRTVNWIIKQDDKRKDRIKDLIDYSFEACQSSEMTFLTDDLNGVIMCSLSEDKMPILEEAYLTLQYVMKVTGVEGISRALKREEYIKQHHSTEDEFIYIWFMGVDKNHRSEGIGSALINKVVEKSIELGVPVFIETSVEQNIGFYEKHGFKIFHVAKEDVFGFPLYFLKRPVRVNNSGDSASATQESLLR